MVDGNRLRALREQRGWTQRQASRRLRVTQAYLSMLENGRRPTPPRLLHALARVFDLPATSLPLPSAASVTPDSQLAEALAALGYPGFRHLVSSAGPMRNPADVLAAALCQPGLDARVVEALPWLAFEYSDLDWNWLVREAKLRDLQNRLGYVVLLARKLADKLDRPEAARRLRGVEQALEQSRLAREDSLAGDALSEAERQWLRARRPTDAKHWNLLTDLTVEQLQHAS
ncbi:MAG: helix-turn-helix domain-containing protein [Terriglobales bacterium]